MKTVSRLSSAFKDYKKNSEGVFALKFALFLTALVMVSGMAVDISRLVQAKSKLQNAADSAVLAAALDIRSDGNEWRKKGFASFDFNKSDLEFSKEPNLSFRKGAESVSLTAGVELKPLFVQIFGFPNMDVTVHSEANLGQGKKIEVSILFDVSTSMEMGTPGKFANAQSAVNALLDDLEATSSSFSTTSPIWVSLIPFGENVSIVERISGTNTNTRSLNWFGPFEEHSPTEFVGDDQSLCAELRSDNNLWDDSPPSAGQFPVWYKKYVSDYGHHRPCNQHTMEPLTSDFASLRSKVDSLTAIDQGTRIDLGILWAWRSLSPSWRGEWWTSDNTVLPHNYNNDDVLKIIVVLTDGENFGSHNWVTGKTLISADELNDDTLDICEDIKFNGIEIFYIDYENPRGVTGELKRCASSNKHYFNADNAEELRNAFKEISARTTELALTK